MSVPQLVCLQTLEKGGPLSIGALSKRVYLNPSTLTGIVDRLEKKGYVLRARGLVDRRVVKVELTEAGREVVNQAPHPLQARLLEALTHLPAEDKLSILTSLQRLLSLMEVGEIQAAPILEVGPLDAADKKMAPPSGEGGMP